MKNNICRCGNRPVNPELEDLCSECAEQISLRLGDELGINEDWESLLEIVPSDHKPIWHSLAN